MNQRMGLGIMDVMDVMNGWMNLSVMDVMD